MVTKFQGRHVVDVTYDSALIDVYEETAVILYSYGWENQRICDEMGISYGRLYQLLDHYGVRKKDG